MLISMFETRTMLQALRQMPRARTFLRDMFFPTEEFSDTTKVDVDIIKGRRSMAPFVSPVLAGKVVANKGFTTKTFEAPLLKPKKKTDAEDIMNRMAGEALYSGLSPDERSAAKLGNDLMELDDSITRRVEWMVAQALFSGKVKIEGEGVEYEIDFGVPDETLTEGALWDAEGSNPIDTLRLLFQTVVKASGVNPDVCILAPDVVPYFINHEAVHSLLDKRLINTGQIDPRQLPNGATYFGHVNELGMDIYSYLEWYVGDDGEEYPMVPEGKILVGSTRAQTLVNYGAIVIKDESGQMSTFVGDRVPTSWVTDDPVVRWVQLQSRPLPVPVQVDAFCSAAVLGSGEGEE